MTQWAHYGEKTVKDLLGYHFSMIKGSAAIGLPDNWSLGLGLEYDYLSSISSGNKMFDAVAPTFSIQKVVPFTEQVLPHDRLDDQVRQYNTRNWLSHSGCLSPMMEIIFRLHSMRPIYIPLDPTENFCLCRILGLLALPTRKTIPSKGRVDYLFTLGASGIYQFREWVGVQTFMSIILKCSPTRRAKVCCLNPPNSVRWISVSPCRGTTASSFEDC